MHLQGGAGYHNRQQRPGDCPKDMGESGVELALSDRLAGVEFGM